MEQDIIEIDSDLGTVWVYLHNEFDPNGDNVIIEYTLDEWAQLLNADNQKIGN